MIANRIPHFYINCIFLAAIASALLFVVYWAGLQGGFFFDDSANIILAETIRLKTLSLESIHQALTSGSSSPSGRPIAQLSFALNHYFSRFDPFAFKLTNLLIHFLNSILVFFVARQLITPTLPSGATRKAIFLAGLIAFAWATHPIQMTSVVYVVQRMTSLSAFFLLAALLLHLFARKRRGSARITGMMLAWFVFWPLSCFSKETGVLFPLFVLAWELILRRNTRPGLDRFSHALSAATALTITVSVVYMALPIGDWLWAGYEMRPFSLGERLLTEARVLCFYIGLILFPRLDALGLYHDDFVISTSLLTPWTTLPALAALATLVWLVWRMRNTRPLTSLGISWFLIGHLLESTVLPLEIAHEHRNYLPIFGILLAGADTLMRLLEMKGGEKTISISLAAAMMAYLPFITALRAHQFGDNIRLMKIEAEYHPRSSRAQYEAGRTLSELPESASANHPIYSIARKHFEQAASLDPHSKLGLLGLINLACKADIATETMWVQELATRLRTPPFAPGDHNVLSSLKEMSIAGTTCLARPEIDGLFAAALINPGISQGTQAMLHSWHADYLWLHEHDMAAARNALGHSLALNPTNPSNRLKWAQLIFIAGERELALELLLKLRNEKLLADERNTLNELLATYNIAGH